MRRQLSAATVDHTVMGADALMSHTGCTSMSTQSRDASFAGRTAMAKAARTAPATHTATDTAATNVFGAVQCRTGEAVPTALRTPTKNDI